MEDKTEVVQTSVDLVNNFFCSARDALDKAKRANPYSSYAEMQSEPRISGAEEIQATLETCIAAFFTVEAALNRIFFESVKTKTETPFDKWLKNRWRFGLSVLDKITLLLHEYAYMSTPKPTLWAFLCFARFLLNSPIFAIVWFIQHRRNLSF